jgi:S-adenosylmethionine uptake transporter
MKNLSKEQLALLLAASSYAFWTFGDVTSKVALQLGVPIFQAVALYSFIVMVISASVAAKAGHLRELWPQNPKPVLGRAILGTITNLCNFMAFPLLPMAGFYVVVFSAPLLISVFGAIFLHEKLSREKLMIILLGFAGVLWAIDPLALWAQGGSAVGYLLAFLGSCAFAFGQVVLRHLSDKEKPATFLFTTAAMQCFFGVAMGFSSFVGLSAAAWVIMVLVGLFSALGSFAMVFAMKKATAATVSSLHYTQLIWGAALGFLIWGDRPGLHLWMGAAVIMASGFWIAKKAKD